MKSITFRPLRRVKKSGKITVAGYMQWRKIKTADYSSFILAINDEYKSFPKDELVYDHNGDNLFWRHYNPNEIPLITGYDLSDGEQPEYPKHRKSSSGMYSASGLDCDGVPAFSHYTADDIFNSKADMNGFEPLTVEIVSWWFGWFLYQLENTNLMFDQKQ